jgi:tRNA(Arg) A34 adenosine deaminase TadA
VQTLPRKVRRADRHAKEYIERSDCKVGMYAEIVRGGAILARGYNKRDFKNYSIHAEINALKQIVRQKNGAEGTTMTIIRYLADNSFGASKPCFECMGAIRRAGIKKINYFDYDGKFCSERVVPNLLYR